MWWWAKTLVAALFILVAGVIVSADLRLRLLFESQFVKELARNINLQDSPSSILPQIREMYPDLALSTVIEGLEKDHRLSCDVGEVYVCSKYLGDILCPLSLTVEIKKNASGRAESADAFTSNPCN